MKKVLLAAACITALCFTVKNANAQTTIKVGLFDIDLMVRALPEYRNVDSLTQMYERDSLGSQYAVFQSEYHRLDSTLKADTLKGVAKSIMDYNNQQKQQIAYQLAYFQQIAQNASDNYRSGLASPLYQKVLAAYKKVLAVKKYNVILKPESYEIGADVENIFPLVAKEMNITLPPGLMIDPNQALKDNGTGAAPPKANTNKP